MRTILIILIATSISVGALGYHLLLGKIVSHRGERSK